MTPFPPRWDRKKVYPVVESKWRKQTKQNKTKTKFEGETAAAKTKEKKKLSAVKQETGEKATATKSKLLLFFCPFLFFLSSLKRRIHGVNSKTVKEKKNQGKKKHSRDVVLICGRVRRRLRIKRNETKQKKEGRGSRRLVQVVFLFVAKFVFFSLVRSSSSISSTTAPPAGCTTTTTTAPLLQLRNKGMILSSRTFRPEESDA